MKILFLDDLEKRHRIFRRLNPGHRIFNVYTSSEAIKVLKDQSPLDEVHLDHDLGGVYLPSDMDSGFGVARFISRMSADMRPGRVTIHSWNETGAENMLRVLREAGLNAVYRPFAANEEEDPV